MDMKGWPNDVQVAFSTYRRWREAVYESNPQNYTDPNDLTDLINLINICGSATEQLLIIDLASLMFIRVWTYLGSGLFSVRKDHMSLMIISNQGDVFWVNVYPQKKIYLDKLKREVHVDFAIFVLTTEAKAGESFDRTNFKYKHIASFIVEVDGFAFHERTKEQATWDKRRERALTAAGYTVLRFSGQEVSKNESDLTKLRTRLFKAFGFYDWPVCGPISNEIWFSYIEPLLFPSPEERPEDFIEFMDSFIKTYGKKKN